MSKWEELKTFKKLDNETNVKSVEHLRHLRPRRTWDKWKTTAQYSARFHE